jgi:hypothetical protein
LVIATPEAFPRLDRFDLAKDVPLSKEMSSRRGAEIAEAFEVRLELARDVPVASDKGLNMSPSAYCKFLYDWGTDISLIKHDCMNNSDALKL